MRVLQTELRIDDSGGNAPEGLKRRDHIQSFLRIQLKISFHKKSTSDN